MKQMASNGSMASQFFPPNFLLQMQQPFPQQPQQLQDPNEHHHLLPAHLNPFLQDFNAMAPPPPMLLGSNDELAADGGAASDEDEEGGSALENPKKRRLSVEQVRTLEKNFEVGNKLEPERKLQLARALGLQPRQVAIWFQNRRARWKTKQLEKDYDALRRQFDAARAENDALLAHNNKLQAEIVALKGGGGGSRQQEAASELINLNVKETEASCSEDSSEINLHISRPPPPAESPATTNVQFYASLGRPGLDIDNLLHSHSSPSPPLKMELGTGNAAPANFGSLLCGAVDEPPQFWPWAADGHPQFN